MKYLLTLSLAMIGLTLSSYAYVPGGCQCTDYVKDNIPAIRSTNLTSIDQKKATMNIQFPVVGSMAVHDLGTYYGHVSVVRRVTIRPDGDLDIQIQEKNLDNKCSTTGTTTITTRTGTASRLKIVGYFDPRFSKASAYPKLDRLSANSSASGSQFWTTAFGSGFERYSSVAMIFGGWCDAWAKCQIPNGVMGARSSTSLTIPLTLSRGTYHLYVFNPSTGKTTRGQKINIY